MKTLNSGVLLLAALSTASASTTPISARVGALDYVEGSAFVNGSAIAGNKDKLPILDNGQALSTGKGHAEMLLTPGVFLRLGDQSAAHLLNASLTDTRLRVDRGAAMLEVDELYKDNRIQVEVGSGTVRVLKTGLYRFQADPATVQVLNGKVETVGDDRTLKAGKHHEVLFSPAPTVAKFKAVPDDDLSRWSRLRSEYVADASVASAQYVYDRGLSWGGYPNWFWNPWFDTWTWFPASGYLVNPYGFGFWSPVAVYNYYPIPYYGRGRIGFVPRTGRLGPSGLNLQRGAALSGARVAPRGMMRTMPRGSVGGFGRAGGGFAHGGRR